jgi:DNA-binding transcriptional LysR family regulator
MLSVQRLRCLQEVAERGSIAAAARFLSFTPSAVSQQIATLERECGVALLERGPRSVRLTNAGRTLVERTQSIVAELQLAQAEIRAIAGLEAGSLRVSSFPSAYGAIMPAAILEFRRRYPNVDLILTEADSLRAIADVKRGRLDLGLAFEYDLVPLPDTPGIELTPLLDEPIHVVLPCGHRAARRSAVRLIELADEPWITSTPRSSCHPFVARACRAAGFEPRIAFQSDDYGVWLGLVEARVGVALIPEMALSRVEDGVAVRRIALQRLGRRVFAVHRAGTDELPAIHEMLTLLHGASALRAAVPRFAAERVARPAALVEPSPFSEHGS